MTGMIRMVRCGAMMRVMGIGMVWMISRPVRIPISSCITNTPTYRIPSAIVVGTIPWVPIPRIPMPRIVDIGYPAPIPRIIEMTSMESCKAKTIIEVNIVAIGKPLLITFAISQVVKTLSRKFVGLPIMSIFGGCGEF